jgi:uncharacterized membrane protein YhiD involved in acid resistance
MEPFTAPSLRLLDLSGYDVFLGMITAFVLSFILVRVSAFLSRQSPSASSTQVPQTMILLSSVVSLIMSVIGNSLARAFGAIGALSLIRFRTSIKDPIDLAKIFMSISIGMASGSGYPQIAVGATALYCIFLGLIEFANPKSMQAPVLLLKLSFKTMDGYNEKLEAILTKHGQSYSILSQNFTDNNKACELVLEISLQQKNTLTALTTELGEALPDFTALVISA